MADSNITKRALASALKALMEEVPFKKISIGDICGKCEMNRKSFYYHFRDKYDLVHWIFQTEMLAPLRARYEGDPWYAMGEICRYLQENRNFYGKIFQIEGQNSLSEYFREFLYPLAQSRVAALDEENEIRQIRLNFYADGIVCAMERWLWEKNPIPAEQFVSVLRGLLETGDAPLHHN